MQETIKIGIVEDDSNYRNTLVKILNKDDRLKVIWNTSSGEEAITLIKAFLPPDIILMDISLGPKNLNGIEAANLINEIDEKIKIIMLTNSEDVYDIDNSIFKGKAMSYITKRTLDITNLEIILKGVLKKELIEKIMQVYSGDVVFSAELIKKLTNYTENGKIDINILSSTQQTIWQLRKDGVKVKDIALRLNMNENTIKTHLKKIKVKLLKKEK